MRLRNLLFGILCLTAPELLSAPEPVAVTPPEDRELEQVRDRVVERLADIERSAIRRSPASGLFEVRHGAAFAYVTPDGRYLLRGDLIDLETGAVLTEVRRRSSRAEILAGLGERAIEFAPDKDRVRHTVYLYADVDCNFCRELHREVPGMNKLGIAVRYLFYPREGLRSAGFQHAQRVYCAADPREALNQAYGRGEFEDRGTTCDNPVAQQYAAALELGVKGTPMMLLPDGRVLYGFIGADALLALLDSPESAGIETGDASAPAP